MILRSLASNPGHPGKTSRAGNLLTAHHFHPLPGVEWPRAGTAFPTPEWASVSQLRFPPCLPHARVDRPAGGHG